MIGRLWAVCAVGGMIWLAGCSSQDARNLGEDTKKLGQDIAPIAGNAALQTKVVTHLSLHKGIDMSGLHIETKDKTVMVSGHVRDAGMHKKVIDAVRETTGVDRVEDKLNVQK